MKYKAYTLQNIAQHPFWAKLSEGQQEAVRVLGQVLPFRTNNYVLEELINVDHLDGDPMFVLNFPQKDMIEAEDYRRIRSLMAKENKQELEQVVETIRMRLNPQPGNQHGNIPLLHGEKLAGVQHKYKETVLFFPQKGQTCHAYCTFCFRWAQFIQHKELAFASREYDHLVEYLKEHEEVTDLLITGGDPMVMSASSFEVLIDCILEAKITHLTSIRIGSKSLSYWPYRFVSDADADQMLRVFEKIVQAGIHLSFMAHFNHPVELSTSVVKKAVKRIQNTGAVIRTQSPLLKHINNKADLWVDMWKNQVEMGMVPYYMFVGRNTGAQAYFGLTLEEALRLFQKAYRRVSGLARTVRGPIMSSAPGKVLIDGIMTRDGDKKFLLKFVQGIDPEWVGMPFFAKYDKEAMWLTDLEPTEDNSRFFFDL